MTAPHQPRSSGYAAGPWPAEDGGPQRQGLVEGLGSLVPGVDEAFSVVSRLQIATTMVITPSSDATYLLTHGIGDEAPVAVEQIDPDTLATIARSADLPGGRIWPGGIGAHANGDLYVAFGRHLHRLSKSLDLLASVELSVDAPHNSFVITDSGHLVVKDFGGRLPSGWTGDGTCTISVLDAQLTLLSQLRLDEGSIARLSCSGDDVVVIGIDHCITARVSRDGMITEVRRTMYRTEAGQGYGWDPVLVDRTAYFLDNGEGSEAFDGSFTGKGIATAPLRLHAVNIDSGDHSSAEICGLPGGLIANPPLVDPGRGIAVGYDSSNGVISAFDVAGGVIGPLRWQRLQHHASHLLASSDLGELVTFDFNAGAGVDELVVLSIDTGEELARSATDSPVQSVLSPSPGRDRSIYYCSLTTVAKISVHTVKG